MATFVPLANGAQIDVLYSLGGEIIENTLWFVSRQPPVDQAQLDNLTVGVASLFEAELLPFLSHNLGFVRVDGRDWTADPPPFTSITNVFASGGSASDSHSANVAIRVRFKGTNLETWRQNSNFIGGIPKDQVQLNTYSDAIKDGIFEAYVSLLDDAAFFGPFPAWRWVTTSRRVNNAPRTEQLFTRTVDIQFPSPYTSPRRKRLPA